MLYSKIEYILLSKIISEKIILEKKHKLFCQIFLNSIRLKNNLFKNIEVFKQNIDSDIVLLLAKYNSLKERKIAEEELKISSSNNIKFLFYEEKRFPENLKKIDTPPIMLYYIGQFPKDSSLKYSISIIGSRNCYENFGGRLAYKVGQQVSKEKIWNISGLALGIDTFGHLGSLSQNGYTGAFLAQGLLTPIYPKENIDLFHKIIKKKGFIATEYPIYSKIYYKKFTLRNRLQAGLVDSLFIPEFNEKSGTLSTIEYGLKYNKNVYICNPKKTLEIDISLKEFNKGNALFSLNDFTLKKLYPDFKIENFKKTRIYKIIHNKSYKYEIVEKIPDFKKNDNAIMIDQQKKLF